MVLLSFSALIISLTLTVTCKYHITISPCRLFHAIWLRARTI